MNSTPEPVLEALDREPGERTIQWSDYVLSERSEPAFAKLRRFGWSVEVHRDDQHPDHVDLILKSPELVRLEAAA